MNRRNFLRMLVGGVATATAVRTFPFRVFSFPSEVITREFDFRYKEGKIQVFTRSLEHIPYFITNANTGTFVGLRRSAAPFPASASLRQS